MAGRRSDEIETLMGMTARGAMIHRDNLALKTTAKETEEDNA